MVQAGPRVLSYSYLAPRVGVRTELPRLVTVWRSFCSFVPHAMDIFRTRRYRRHARAIGWLRRRPPRHWRVPDSVGAELGQWDESLLTSGNRRHYTDADSRHVGRGGDVTG